MQPGFMRKEGWPSACGPLFFETVALATRRFLLVGHHRHGRAGYNNFRFSLVFRFDAKGFVASVSPGAFTLTTQTFTNR